MHTGQIRHTGAVDKDVKGYFLQTAQRLGSVSAPHDRGQRLRRLGAVSVCTTRQWTFSGQFLTYTTLK